MKRLFAGITGMVLLAGIAAAGDLTAVLHKKDGRAWRVFLLGNGGDHLLIRLEKSTVGTREPLDKIVRLEISHPDFNRLDAERLFNQGDYTGTVAMLETAAAPAGPYMAVPNNLQEAFLLLMKAWYFSGDSSRALAAAMQLQKNPDPQMQLQAQVYGVLAALGVGDLSAAEAIWMSIRNPAAQIYARACMERARGLPKTAIQSAVELIAGYPDETEWMALTELMCAELYLEMGMTNSAAATARQTARLYKGSHVEQKAQALRSKVEPEAGKTD